MLVACVATMSASAQNNDVEVDNGWVAFFTPVEDADDLNAVHVAQSSDGAVYVSSTYDQSFTFANKALAATDGMLSSVILKYDKDGKELWSATLVGNITITAMTADEDGTVYVAGSFDDEVEYTGADGVSAKISSEDALSAFVAKVSKDGKFEAVKVITATPDADLLATELYFPEDIYITPSAIKLNGNKVYVAANYNACSDDLGWKAAYVNVFDFMYLENRSKGIFSLNKSDLSGAASVLTVQSTERISYAQVYPEALNFDFDADGNVIYAFIGFGNLTLATPGGSKDFTFETTDDDSGMKDHAFVLGSASDLTKVKEFTGNKHTAEATPYSIAGMAVQDGVLYLAGTTFGPDWFDVSYDGNGEIYPYVTAFNASDFKPKWDRTGSPSAEATMLYVAGDEVHLATNKGVNYTIDLSTGDMTEDNEEEDEDEDPMVVTDVAAWGNEYAAVVAVDDNEVTVLFKNLTEDDADDDTLEEGLIEIEQSQGFEYDNFARATLEEGDDYNTYTVTENLQIAIKMMDVDVQDCDYVVIKFAEPVAAGWKLAFWSNQDLTDVPEGATEYKYVFAEDPNCGVKDGVLPQICMMTFFGGFTAPLEAKVIGIYKHSTDANAVEAIEAPAKTTNGQRYNLAGQPVDENYKGFVIIDGKTYYVK